MDVWKPRRMQSDLLESAMQGCDGKAVAHLLGEMRQRVFDKGDTLYSQNDAADCIYLVVEGCIIVERTNVTGDITSYRIASRGDFLGHRSYFAQEPRATAPRCMTPVVALFIPGAAVDHAVHMDPEVGIMLAREIARDDGPRLGAVVRSHRILGLVRLAFLLHHLDQKVPGMNGAGSNDSRLPFNQHDLANMLDLRNETISRLLHQLQDMGVLSVTTNPRGVEITDRAALTGLIQEYL